MEQPSRLLVAHKKVLSLLSTTFFLHFLAQFSINNMSAKFRSFLVLALTVGMIKVSALPLESQSIANRGSTHSSFPLPHNVTGQDEPGVWGGIHVHDPSIIEGPDGSYYSFTTHDLIAISRAPSLDGYWDLIGSVLDSDSVINLPGRNDTWAPDVHKVGDTYFLYYSVSEFGSQDSAIGLATSKTLLPGSWTDHGQIIRSGNETGILLPLNITNAIDPNLFIDPKTNDAYLSYGSFFGDIWQFRLKEELTAVTYTPPPVQVSLDPAGTRPEEGSFLSYHDGYYYLWYSHGICCGFNASALPPAGTE